MLKSITTAAVASVALMAGAAHATTFTQGTLAIAAFTDTQTNLLSTTVFDLSLGGLGDEILLSGGTNSFTGLPLSPALTGSSLDLGNPSSFSFNASGAGIGTFNATSITAITTTSTSDSSGTHNTLQFYVGGMYTVGAAFTNSGTTLSADETFSLTQTLSTGNPLGAISVSGTFQSPAAPPPGTPEPATLSLFGAALAGLGLARRRRK